jgi:hypothetical protein
MVDTPFRRIDWNEELSELLARRYCPSGQADGNRYLMIYIGKDLGQTLADLVRLSSKQWVRVCLLSGTGTTKTTQSYPFAKTGEYYFRIVTGNVRWIISVEQGAE